MGDRLGKRFILRRRGPCKQPRFKSYTSSSSPQLPGEHHQAKEHDRNSKHKSIAQSVMVATIAVQVVASSNAQTLRESEGIMTLHSKAIFIYGAAVNYYAESDLYFAQRTGARSDHNQALRASLFADLSAEAILDFGCGTGGIISRLSANRRIGVEIGHEAAEVARSKGIEVYLSLNEVPPVDIAISFHALEHVDGDVASLEGIFKAVKPGGRVRLIVPGELPNS